MNLAKRIRDCRYAKGWGPDELARNAEISRTALYQIESGKTERPRAATLQRIAKALDVSIDVLLGNEGVGGFRLTSFAAPASDPGSRPASGRTREGTFADEARFQGRPEPAEVRPGEGLSSSPLPSSTRERDLARKLHELLESPMGGGVARILEELHRLLRIDQGRPPE